MIPLARAAAPDGTRLLLDRRGANVRQNGGTAAAARAEWAKAAAARQHVRRLLAQMASGEQRCMYCEDSLGSDIDHFEPIARAPLRAFDWGNHLLACSHCNSNFKRDEYPRDADGSVLLVDPSAEDPADHLALRLASGVFEARSAKGEATIRVFGLNRADLVRGRAAAFVRARALLCQWQKHGQAGETQEADELSTALLLSPFATVVYTMERLAPTVAAVVLKDDVRAAVAAWRAVRGLSD